MIKNSPCKTKVANFEHTVRINEEISRFDVSVDDLCRVQVLDTSQDLVEKYFNVVLGQVLRRYYDLVQIRLHEFSDHVDLLKEVYVGRLKETKKHIVNKQF